MKRNTTGKPSESDLAALRSLPDAPVVIDEETPYDPNDPAAVQAFWKDAVLVRNDGAPAVRAALAARGRGPGRKPKKILLSVRYSAEVLDFFKSTGEGWQTRMDEALREWVAAHRSA